MKKFLTLLLLTCFLGYSHAQTEFCVNMNGYGGTFTTVYISGTFNGWNGTANPLDDADGDGIWCATVNIPLDAAGSNDEFKFQVDGWADQENFAGGEPCTDTNFGFTNRVFAGDAQTCVMWNSCDASPCLIEPDGEPIPTMSEWGLMIFFLLVMNLSLVFLRRLEVAGLRVKH